MRNQKILIVDDSEMNRALLVDMLEDQYEIEEAENGAEAIDILKRRSIEFSLILLDIVMPVTDGFSVLAFMRQEHILDNTAVIMISSDDSSENIKKAYYMGAFDYISRPFDYTVVRHRVSNTMMLYMKQHHLENIVVDQIYEQQKNNKLMISILSHIVEFRNGESGRHVTNVGRITELLLKRLVNKTDRYKLTSEEISLITTASALHDIGKISIPDEILNKPGRLTPEEFEIMKQHSAVGADMLKDLSAEERESELVKMAYQICRWHHERYDGKGYPDGLRGDDIPISAQVVAIADVYDALTSERCYKAAYTHDEAVQMIMEGKCGAFNPMLLDCLSAVGGIIGTDVHKQSVSWRESQTLQNVRDKLNRYESIYNKRNMDFINQLSFETQRYEFISDISNVILMSYNKESAELHFNPYGVKKLGLSDIVVNSETDSKLRSVFNEHDLERLKDMINDSTADNSAINLEMKLTVDGTEAYYHFIGKTIWTSDIAGKMIGMVGSLIEISSKKQNNREKKLLSSDLIGALELIGCSSFDSRRALEIIKYLQLIFDSVHLINVSCEHFGMLDETGEFIPGNEFCYSIWNKNIWCKNCIAAKVLSSKGRASKLEFMGDDVFFILASYIEIDGNPYSLIMVAKLNDETIMEESGREALIQSISRYNEQLLIDSLTNVYNRRYYDEYLKAVEREQGVAVVDLDNLKVINDTYGHTAGDEALVSIAEIISGCISENDNVIRYGGDEFVIVFHDSSMISDKLEEIRSCINSKTMKLYPEVKLSVSIGGVYGNSSTMELFYAADSVMFRAKKMKNKVIVMSLEAWEMGLG